MSKRISIGLFAVALGGIAGCYDNVHTDFPPGTEPFQDPNQAAVPAATATDVCPEMLNEVEVHDYGVAHVSVVHAAGCIHAPPAMVWAQIQNFETSRAPADSNSLALVDPPMASECDGAYETQVNAGPSGFTVDFRLCWRHTLVHGTDDAPTLTATRWQKVWGSSAIRTLEGSLVSMPHPMDPDNVTEVFYQYHLDSASLGESNQETINRYVTTIYGRLVRASHGEVLTAAN
jgi:hypothetical protein